MKRLAAVLPLMLLAGCEASERPVSPERAARGLIAEYQRGDYLSLYERCQNGDRLYLAIGARETALAVIPGGCAGAPKAEIR